MFSANTHQDLFVNQPISDATSSNMDIDVEPQDVEMEENPASKIKISFECTDNIKQNKIGFSLHFKTHDMAPNTVATANDLLNFLLTPDFDRGIFSESSRKYKFRQAKHSGHDERLGYYFNPDFPKKNEGVFNQINKAGEATIAFGNVPCYCCLDDTPGALLVMLSMLDDAIYVMKKSGYDINFTILDVIKKLAESYANNQTQFGKHHRPDNNPNTLKQLISLIEKHPNLPYGDAILLCYSFSLVNNDHFLDHIESNLQENNTIDYLKLIDSICTGMMSYKYSKDVKLSERVNCVLDRLNLCNKIKLFRPALGSRADDGGLYNWSYTEWQFLRDAKFRLDDAGRMIIDVREENNHVISEYAYNKNSGYIQHYAPGKPCHAIFSQELKGLEVLTDTGLAFEPESSTLNMHDKIVFTQSCSAMLRAMQLDIDVDSAKQAMKARNHFRFFQQNSQTGFLKEYLPPEIASKISSLVHFKVEDRKLSEQEIIERQQEAEYYQGRW